MELPTNPEEAPPPRTLGGRGLLGGAESLSGGAPPADSLGVVMVTVCVFRGMFSVPEVIPVLFPL